ncbi:uncharacterized protein LOC118277126 isoform X3 [Spodoptera frugiperda]|uniref:Uncharacterized protein LOC118277126 isoform X3 n=1 Tax=Spodoptera frugiperda TaxID=7108 RepID=A0A9R0DFW5_SPOFR|nr:uncharacterized protein LOC118277126 isoform X3 [Spodoptera frugiperda]
MKVLNWKIINMNKRMYVVTGLFMLQCCNIIADELGKEKIYRPCTSNGRRHQWVQYYQSKKPIMSLNITKSSVKETNFIMYLEPFDNSSTVQSIDCLNKTTNLIRSIIQQHTIHISASPSDYESHNNTIIKYYNDKESTEISCDKYEDTDVEDVNIGTVTTSSHEITIYPKRYVNMALNRSFDQAGVYCLYYVRSGNDTVVNITRHVTKIQLVYKDTYTSSDLEGPNHEDNSQQMYMIVVGIVTVVALVIAIAILYRNRRRKKTNDTPNEVSYVELDMPEQVVNTSIKEESPYAQIIGEMRPPNLASKPTYKP